MEGGGWESHYWSFLVCVINVWPLNCLKLQPIQLLEQVLSSSSSQIHFDCHREQPPASPSPDPLMTKPKDLLLSVGTSFFMWKNCGLMNTASWLASNKTFWRRKCNGCSSQIFLPGTSGIPFCCFKWPELYLN